MVSEVDKLLERLKRDHTVREHDIIIDGLAKHREAIETMSEFFRNSERDFWRLSILEVYQKMNWDKLPQDSANIIMEDSLRGLADRNVDVRCSSSDILGAYCYMKSLQPTTREKLLNALMENYENVDRETVANTLGHIDYKGIEHMKKKSADFLEKAAKSTDSPTSTISDPNGDAAKNLKIIGSKASIDAVRKFWLAKLDGGNEDEVNRALHVFKVLESTAAADKIRCHIKEGRRGFDCDLALELMSPATNEAEDKAIIKLLGSGDLGRTGRYCMSSMEIIGKKGWKESLKLLNEIAKDTKVYDEQDRETARNSIRDIEGRMTVSAEPARRTLEGAMEREKKKKVPS